MRSPERFAPSLTSFLACCLAAFLLEGCTKIVDNKEIVKPAALRAGRVADRRGLQLGPVLRSPREGSDERHVEDRRQIR